MSDEDKRCKKAFKNPVCPYLTQINQQSTDITQIKKALIGDDLQGGLVEQVSKLKLMYKILIFIGGTCVATFIGIMIKVVFNV